MNVSRAIEILQQVLRDHGDLPVRVFNDMTEPLEYVAVADARHDYNSFDGLAVILSGDRLYPKEDVTAQWVED